MTFTNRITQYLDPPDGLEGLLGRHETNTAAGVGALQQADIPLKQVDQVGAANLKLWSGTNLIGFVEQRCHGVNFPNREEGAAFKLRSGNFLHTIGGEVSAIRDANPVLVQNGGFILGKDDPKDKLRLINALHDMGIPSGHIHTQIYHAPNPYGGSELAVETVYVTIDRQMIDGLIKAAVNASLLEESVNDMLTDASAPAGKRPKPISEIEHKAREEAVRADIIKALLGPGLAKAGGDQGRAL